MRSKQDKEAMKLLEAKTVRVMMDGIERYATPLLCTQNAPTLKASKESVMLLLHQTEHCLVKIPAQAQTYIKEIDKLVQAGYVSKLTSEQISNSVESWYIPHHRVEHNCSFSYQGQVLNSQLLPGPILGPSLLGVLLCFQQRSVAISGNIKTMFHQIRLRGQTTIKIPVA